MAVLEVVKWPAKVLETRASEVTVFDDALRSFVADMHETMDSEHGIGLAANQVDDLRRVLAIHIPHRGTREEEGEPVQWWHNKRFTLINPVITKSSGKVKCMEGCLSFPEIYEYVERSEKVTVQAVDEHGQPQTFEADGLFAICLQHEIDHLDGIVFISRMGRLKANLVRKRYMRTVENIARSNS